MKKYLLMYLSIFSVLFVSNQFVYAEDSEVSVFDVEQNMELEENIVEDVTLESSVFESSLPIEEYSSAWVEGNAVPEPYGIIGSDDRYRVDTTKYPNSAVVRLGFSNGIRDYAGTGFLVSPDTVVTAAHCVYSNGRWTINGLKIQPGYDSGYLPFGQTSDIRSVYILKSWKSGGGAYGSKYNTKDDIAVIKLKKKIGDRTGYFGMRQAVSGNVNVTGYPGSNNATDKNKYGKMYSSFGPIVSSTSYELSYRIDTTSGHSGSPIHTPDHYTVGVHVGGGSVMNDGVRFNDEYYNFVKGIKDQYVAKQFNKNVTVTKEGTTIWGNFDWNNKKGNTTGKLGKVYKAKYVYKLDNNNSYYSLYNVDGSWAGYINSGACTEVKSQSLNKNVTITKEGLTLWENFFFSGKKGNTAGKLGKVYNAKLTYTLGNGVKYYSLYNAEGSWAGYINSSAAKELKADTLNKDITITKEGFTTWGNFYFSNKKGNTQGSLGKVYKAKYTYTLGNGVKYYSLYNSNDSWAGYLNASAAKELKAEALNRNITIAKEGYTIWSNFYFSAKKGNTTGKLKTKYNAKYVYTLGNGVKYYSLYDSSNVWSGYLNTGAATNVRSLMNSGQTSESSTSESVPEQEFSDGTEENIDPELETMISSNSDNIDPIND